MNQTRLGDLDTGHDACPPTALANASPNVLVNGKGAGRVGDAYVPHSCPIHGPHVGTIVSGSGSVVINGKAGGRIGDNVSCGGAVVQGSPNVIVGG